MAEAKQPGKLKGGRKGGTRFPNINLQKALEYTKKLVSKTHGGPQPEQTILVGVFNNKGPIGQVRASALKQYNLMDGDAKEGYVASQLARQIEAALPDEQPRLRQQAFLASKLFKKAYDTLRAETATRARVRQVVITAEVHPDLADACVTCFMEGAVYASLGILDGDSIALADISKTDAATAPNPTMGEGTAATEVERQSDEGAEDSREDANHADSGEEEKGSLDRRPQNAEVRVSLTVDSSSDPDKLEKQLRLLKQYGLLRS
jgi:hypothetical protein